MWSLAVLVVFVGYLTLFLQISLYFTCWWNALQLSWLFYCCICKRFKLFFSHICRIGDLFRGLLLRNQVKKSSTANPTHNHSLMWSSFWPTFLYLLNRKFPVIVAGKKLDIKWDVLYYYLLEGDDDKLVLKKIFERKNIKKNFKLFFILGK